MTTTWGPITDGFAQGPTVTVEHADETYWAQLLWTDADGKSVCIQTPDEPLPADTAQEFAKGILALASLDDPQTT